MRNNLSVLLLVFVLYLMTCTEIARSESVIPTFYIDPVVLKILGSRRNCFRGANAIEELMMLKTESATEYFRGHELIAHFFFVEQEENPHRRDSLEEAEFEYIPLLPLAWLTKTSPICSYQSLIQDLLKAYTYLTSRDKAIKEPKPKFCVASTFNLRTEMGSGMPTQLRRGEAWNAMSQFVMSLSIGHYERWPQCPDLLRKWWKYVLELPYLGMNIHSYYFSIQDQLQEKKFTTQQQLVATQKRRFMFYFSGNFQLFGPELVCSVRNAIINLSLRNDFLVVNTTMSNANSGIRYSLLAATQQSVFCLIGKGDSYSSAMFYLALSGGCIPIVVSDWFTFSFPWIIPYDKFVVRVSEADFLKNPHAVLDYIKSKIGGNKELLRDMQGNLVKYSKLLGFSPVEYGTEEYRNMLKNDIQIRHKEAIKNDNFSPLKTKNKIFTFLPMELMLLELRYAQKPHQFYNNIPCYRPYMCLHLQQKELIFSPQKKDYFFYPTDKNAKKPVLLTRTYTKVISEFNPDPDLPPEVILAEGYQVVDSGLQVNPLFFEPNLEETRSHLCQHVGRLIGQYKMVFFMQCVRILWPLHPGQFKPFDNADRFSQRERQQQFVDTSESEERGITVKDYNFVRSFHNIDRPSDWVLLNYPVISNFSKIHSVSSLPIYLQIMVNP